ncbi:hypothetical protein ABZS29_25135 [Kribbella sp. NPDC005582]|uniref:hypothetical protein n=1 Tax=Kribbella sp. NPDC005582 TaxID=3156893 RepID=UPI0033AF60E8
MPVYQVDPSSEEYRRFVRLYEAARRTRPAELDRWNGELYEIVGEGGRWGSLQVDGSLQLSRELVLDKLGPDAAPQEQAQALTTILHEAYHARVEINAVDEPNAVLSERSKALDEGLTEWVAVDDASAFAALAGYDDLPDPAPEYPHAHHATAELLEYAAGPEGARDLAIRALDQPVVMRWDAIADELVKNRLSDIVPADAEHQQAARAELINSMAHAGWTKLHKSTLESAGQVAAKDSTAALDAAAQRIREHYATNTAAPYASSTPNFLLARQQQHQKVGGAQERTSSHGGEIDLTKLPPPALASRVEGRGAEPRNHEGAARPADDRQSTARRAGMPVEAGTEARFLSGLAPAAGAVRHKPQLGNGARGAGAPGGGRGGVERPVDPSGRGRG